MNKIWIILRKELKEIFQQRVMLTTMLLFPIIVLGINGYFLIRFRTGGRVTALGSRLGVNGMTPVEISQLVTSMQFRIFLLSQSLLLPSVIAAYSIVGEKNNKTLEPILATPISTGQLLLAKSLAALLPTVGIVWLSGLLFSLEIGILSTLKVLQAVATPGWLVLLLITVPVVTVIPISLAVMVSSRANDPRTASQAASLIFIILVIGSSVYGGGLVFNPLQALGITAGLVVLGAALLWAATRVFQREAILTRWT